MTEKEKQIEEIRKILDSCCFKDWDGYVRSFAPYSGAVALYDAGYRLPAPLSPISDTDIREALKKDFRVLYVQDFTVTWKAERLIRSSEIDVMGFPNLKMLLAANRKSSGQG